MQLLERTELLLSQRIAAGWKLRQITTASGGEIEYDWLKRFAKGRTAKGGVPDPTISRVQKLHDFLVNLPADVA